MSLKNLTTFFYALLLIALVALFLLEYRELFDLLGNLAKERLTENPFFTFIFTPVLFWISAFLCRQFCEEAAGNKLQIAINRLQKDPRDFSKVAPLLNFRFVTIKAISSLIADYAGGALGKEGPSVHMSAGICATFYNRYKKFFPKLELENFVYAGSAIGLAIVFNAPIAGLVFVIEKLSKAKFRNFKKNISCTIFAIIFALPFFYQKQSLFTFRNVDLLILKEIPAIFITVIFCALLAKIFQKTVSYFYEKFSAIKSDLWHIIPVFGGVIVAYLNFYCGIYSFGGGAQTIQEVLSGAENLLSYKEVFGRIINTIITYSSGLAGGLIAPALTIGLGLGSIAAVFFASANIGAFFLIGMTAFLSVIIETPFAAGLIVFEATGQSAQNIIPLILIALIAFAVGKKIIPH